MLSPVLPFQRNKIESTLQAWIPRFEYGDYRLMDMDCFHPWVSIWVLWDTPKCLTNVLQTRP